MTSVGQRKILTQQRVIAFFTDALGYVYLGRWQDREGNIEAALLTDWLKRRGLRRYDTHSTDLRARRGRREELNRAPLAHETWRY